MVARTSQHPPHQHFRVLIDHIHANGGEVVAATALAHSQSKNYLKARPQDIAKLLDKSGMDAASFEREFGYPIAALTGAETYRLANLDRGSGAAWIRSRIPARRRSSDSRGSAGGSLSSGSGEEECFSLAPRYKNGVHTEANDCVDPDSLTYHPPADGDSFSLGKRDRGEHNLTLEQEEAIRTGIAAAQGAIANARSNGGRSPGERQEILACDRIASGETALVAAGLKPVFHEAWVSNQEEAATFVAGIKQAFPHLEAMAWGSL